MINQAKSCPDALKKDEVLIVKVGSDERPASPSDIIIIQGLLEKTYQNQDTCLVTHHAIDFEIISRKHLKNIIVR